MGSNIEDVTYEMHLQKQWENERKEVFTALEKIANSENISELQQNLDKLKNIYSSEISIDDAQILKLISELDFSMPRLKEYMEEGFKKSDNTNKKYFIVGILFAVIGILIGLVIK